MAFRLACRFDRCCLCQIAVCAGDDPDLEGEFFVIILVTRMSCDIDITADCDRAALIAVISGALIPVKPLAVSRSAFRRRLDHHLQFIALLGLDRSRTAQSLFGSAVE